MHAGPCSGERAASSDSFVVYSDSVDLFMSRVLCVASLKAHATNHSDCTALDRVSDYKAITLIFDWQQPIPAAVKSDSKPGILWFIMNLQLVGTGVSVCALEFSNGSVDQQGIFLL